MRRALESAGVEFTTGAQPGVRLATETGKFPESIGRSRPVTTASALTWLQVKFAES